MSPRRALVLLPALLSMMLVLSPAASASPASFSDVVGTPYEDAVVALSDAGIVNGCETDRFCAREQISRGQAATMLVGALDLPAARAGGFSDIAGSTHATSIDSLADAGLIAGCGDGRFCPQDPITREQLATMLRRAFDVPDATNGATYFDDVGDTHGPAVRALAEAGIATGCGDPLTAFCATAQVQRAHAAMFLARTLKLVDAVELAPFEDRRAEEEQRAEQRRAEEQRKAEAAAAKAAAEAEAEAAAQAVTPATKAVEVAMAQLGKPYRWGGSGPNSFDCSGLTSFAWAQAGVDLPRTSRAQFSDTTRISRSQLRPGDLVFYHSPVSHVAMYIGDGKVVEAPNSSNPVRVRADGLTRSGIVGYGRP